MVNTSPSQGDIHGFKSHMGHQYKNNQLLVGFLNAEIAQLVEQLNRNQ